MDETFRCGRCEAMKPRDQYSKCATCARGFQYYCRACASAKRRIARAPVKTCEKCAVAQLLTEFYQSRITDDGLFGICKTCCNLENRPTRTKKKHYIEYISVETSYGSMGRR